MNAAWSSGAPGHKRLFKEQEAELLSTSVAEALRKAGPDDRVYFEVRAPGNNRAYDRDIIAGWLAVRDPYLYLTIEHFHKQVPMTTEDPYFKSPRYPSLQPAPAEYVLYFFPAEFWISNPNGTPGIDYRKYLASGKRGKREQASISR